tara:strand:- start:752 stop:1483 length:732 start_codon:yes stop_codon:yes gene_type:complete
MEAIVREAASEYVYGVRNPARVANKYKLSTLKKILLEEYDATLKEDGHEDTSSAVRKLKTSIEDAGEILQGLQSHHGDLPSWWMSKVTIAADYLNKARDYFLVSGDVMQEEELDERCQKGYKTHPTRKTKQMFGRTYRNCIKAEGMEEDAMDEIFGLTNSISSNILHLGKEDRALIERDLDKIRDLAQTEVMDERKLKPSEKKKLKSLEKKVPKKDFTDRYGEEGKSIYYATLTKMAKKDKKK